MARRDSGRPTVDEQLERAALLAEPVRRALYLHVARQPAEVSRDQAADAVGIDRSLAAFHLDKLIVGGLLDASYRRLSGRTGPGAGRPSKLYRRSDRAIEVSVPERQYELLAQLFADAIETSDDASAALRSASRVLGESIGGEARAATGPRPDRRRLLESAEGILERMGFQPYRDEQGAIRMRDCPFDALAKDHRDLVCRANLELMDGMLEGLRAKGVTASLEPAAQGCCVALRTTAKAPQERAS